MTTIAKTKNKRKTKKTEFTLKFVREEGVALLVSDFANVLFPGKGLKGMGTFAKTFYQFKGGFTECPDLWRPLTHRTVVENARLVNDNFLRAVKWTIARALAICVQAPAEGSQKGAGAKKAADLTWAALRQVGAREGGIDILSRVMAKCSRHEFLDQFFGGDGRVVREGSSLLSRQLAKAHNKKVQVSRTF